MSTYIQGIEYIDLRKQGWKSGGLSECGPDIEIGGPIKMVSPKGKHFWLMPDGTLKEDLPA